MGNEPPKKIPQKSLEDHIIDMKINSRQIQRSAKNSQKQEKKYIKQAKQALRKNNGDFAQLYATSASQKHNEALNYRRTAIKMQLMCDQIKSMKNNQKMMMTFGQLSHTVSEQMNQVDNVKMAENMQMFNDKMDQALIDNKVMTQLMNGNDLVDTNAEGMMDVLKNQIALEEQNKMDVNVHANANVNLNQAKQEQQFVPQKQMQGGKEEIDDPFLDQLKGL